MLGLWILYLTIVLWIATRITGRILSKYILCIVCMLIANVPLFFSHYSAMDLVYAFFDTPNLLCVLIAISSIGRVLVVDSRSVFSKAIPLPPTLKPITFLLYAIFGTALLLGTLNILPWLDLYHFEPPYQNLIVLGIMGAMIILDSMIGIFFALSCVILLIIPLGGGDGRNIIEVVFCPYLWIYSVGYTLFMIFTLPKRYYEKRALV